MTDLQKGLKARGVKMTDDEFQESVGKAMRRNDESEVPEIAEAAQYYRAEMTPMVEELQKMGILAEDLEVTTALSYFRKSRNVTKMIAQDAKVKRVYQEHFTQERDRYLQELPELRKESKTLKKSIKESEVKQKALQKELDELESTAKKTAEINEAIAAKQKSIAAGRKALRLKNDRFSEVENRKSIAKLDDTGLQEKAAGHYDSMIGLGDKRVQASTVMDNVFGSTPTARLGRSRTVTVPDALEEGWLDNNAFEAFASFMANASSAIHTQRMIENLGFDTLNDMKLQIAEIGKRRISAATTEKAKLKAKAEVEKAIEDLQTSVNILTGRHGKTGNFDSALQILRVYETMVMLGGVTLSSFPDVAMSIFKHGLGRTLRDGWIPGIKAMVKGDEFRKMSKQNLQDLGIGVDVFTNDILKSLVDSDFRQGRRLGKVEKGVAKAGNIFSKLTLLPFWNDGLKTMNGHVASARLMRNIETVVNGGTLSKTEQNFMGLSRIDKRFYNTINDNFKRHGGHTQGSIMTNFHLWDPEAKRVFGSAVRSNVDSTILTPGKGDIPQIVQGSEVGKTLFLFQSFMSTATNKIAISGLARHDKESLQGVVALLGMGMLTYIIKEKIAGREPDLSMDNLLLQGVSRTGMLGLIGDKALSLNPWTKDAGRYAGGNLLSAIAGPTPQFIQNAYKFGVGGVNSVTDNAMGNEDTFNPETGLKLLPGQNLFYIRKLLNEVYDEEDK
jgi:hypothetical protein